MNKTYTDEKDIEKVRHFTDRSYSKLEAHEGLTIRIKVLERVNIMVRESS